MASYQLDRITIEGFKSIKNAEIALRPVNLLIGANGAGKTNFIGAFQLLREMVSGDFQNYVARKGGAPRLLRFGPKVTDKIRLRLEFGPNGYEAILNRSVGDSLFFEKEECSFHGDPSYNTPYVERLGSGHQESRLPIRSGKPSVPHYVLESLKRWRLYHFHDTSETALVKQKHPIHDSDSLRSDASNLAAFLYRLKVTDNLSYQHIVGSVQLVAPFFKDFDLRPDPLDPQLIQLLWHEKGSDIPFDGYTLSDGTLRFICLSTLLLQPHPPTTVLIDEPELGLHPFAIHQLAALIQSAAKRTQVIVSTQSVTLVNQFGPEDILVVDRTTEGSAFRRLSPEDVGSWMDGYSLGELWEKNIFGGRPT